MLIKFVVGSRFISDMMKMSSFQKAEEYQYNIINAWLHGTAVIVIIIAL